MANKKSIDNVLRKKIRTYKVQSVEIIQNFEHNSRTHSEDQIQEVVNSINEFGYTNPLLVDGDNVLIAGHCRLEAAKRAGLTEIPCIMIDDLTEGQKAALVIADNKMALNAGWDFGKLAGQITFLRENDYNTDLTGFKPDEILSFMPEEVPSFNQDEDAVPEPPPEPITKLGDVWVMGKHRLMCGDATVISDMNILMVGKKATMVFTDPPYNMKFSGGIHADGSKSFNSKYEAIKNDDMSQEEANEFFDSVNGTIRMYCDGAFYITFYRLGILDYWKSLERNALQVRSLIIWNKGNHTLSNSDYMSMYEPIFYGWVDKHDFKGGNNGRDIWDISRTSKNDLHPTMKPVELVEKAIDDSSKQNDIVLDIFGGSGTTLIACEKQKRSCRMMELSPLYCDVIVKRWEQFTGKKAELETNERI